jgi:2-dehydro-3-deoxyphosphogluconate aldolase/(4S)-4-hydroxy-2-oxoglutarate aldolase
MTLHKPTTEFESILRAASVIPVLTIRRIEDAVPLADALVKGGLTVLEITLRSEIATRAIRRIGDAVPGAIAGAGTILDTGDLADARNAGARFGVSPGLTPELAAAIAAGDMPFLPGVATAS